MIKMLLSLDVNQALDLFLTVATTLVGLLPLYFFGGPLFQPVAVVLIFGLVTDTVLALGVIPVIYALFYKIDFADYKYDESRLIENKPTENKDAQS